MNTVNVPDWCEGTIIEKILKFDPANATDVDQEIAEDEEVIGEMTILEKAMQSLMNNCREEAEEKIEIHKRRMLKSLPWIEPSEESPEEKEAEEALRRLEKKLNAYSGILWNSILNRFPGIANIGVRAGFKVVKMPESVENGMPEGAGIHIMGFPM